MVKEMRWLYLAVVLVLIGCSRSGPTPVDVSGKVEFEGKPLSDGEIQFIDMEQGKAPEVLEINAGAFSGKVTPGKKQVRIFAYRPGKAPPANTPGADSSPGKENYIPSQYNTETRIEETVKSEGGNNFDYKLLAK